MTPAMRSRYRAMLAHSLTALAVLTVLISGGSSLSEQAKDFKTEINWDVTVKVNGKTLEPGDVFKDCDVCPEMVVIPPGSFVMGREVTATDLDGKPLGYQVAMQNSTPPHKVSINRPFAVGRFEITRGNYEEFVDETGYRASDFNQKDKPNNCFITFPFTMKKLETEMKEGEWVVHKGGSTWETVANPLAYDRFPQTSNHPLVCLDWKDVQAYLKWLTIKTGQNYRMLTESEWEYVAKAGTDTGKLQANKSLCEWANVNDLSFRKMLDLDNPPPAADELFFACEDGYAFSAPVGSFPPNEFGVYDMLGNVAEIVDAESPHYPGGAFKMVTRFAGLKNPKVEKFDAERRQNWAIQRGGGWDTLEPAEVDVAFRKLIHKNGGCEGCGFRIARELVE